MDRARNVFIGFIIYIVILMLAFIQLGPIWGFVALGIFFLFSIYKYRAYFYAYSGTKKYSNGDFEGALKELKKAIIAAPKRSDIRRSYAYLLLKLGYTEEASVQIEEGLRIAESDQEKYTLRLTKGLVMWKQNNIDEAIAELSDLLKVYENTNVYASLGFLYIDKGDLQKALEFNIKAKEYNSSNAIVLDNLGTTYILLEDFEKAYEIYQEVMELKPQFPEAYYNYSKVLDHMGDLEQALKMVKTALSMRFWNISTISKEEAEELLNKLEAEERLIDSSEKE